MQWLSTAELKPYTPHGNANNPDTLEKASVKNADAIIIAYEHRMPIISLPYLASMSFCKIVIQISKSPFVSTKKIVSRKQKCWEQPK
ncbi:hypothetical protein [Fastidiosibacter lacustris]|uniref:hypothetical protein n=1 Tax=Fastidiosibacter lacustris TaxID=2056695 RepID=UPI000E3448E9|nr:hypothetical protein [Fastidiosibacter lacustris]